MSPSLARIDHLVLTVRDVEETIAFYSKILGMTRQRFRSADGSDRHALGFGDQKINLHVAGAEFLPHAMQPVSGSADICFMSETLLEAWLAHLTRCGIAIEDGPVARTGATGPLVSIYIRDPDGNLIEISNPGG